MLLLQGVTLTNANGEIVQGEALDCRAFQPKLNKFYDAAGDNLDIVFVGSDATAEDQFIHLKDKQGPWWMVPFEGDTRTRLKRFFGVCAKAEENDLIPISRCGGIPTLIVIRSDGEVVDFHAANTVERDGIKALTKWRELMTSK
ncbi:Thioredoxin, nucleoredoxin and related proteins [Plasmopara halstedii]|uniref:Thioredoxin, nucleoredoxin and related proteins n=1 Tax=Plasmopara halstedii TaxID=4781 RepID=A0A0P1AV70_PLAHL|nr:Thioredoxin, nucleoredoxin and related proteins [Plasmopara halstedii]CEG45353.1 Thioredoxin, nucleoredoxin and related proteins [Plasmopara halstedii]|eukprot:XP_024581722.1 Thioredoxin, nucleoredoxin and related proteins [Plasmopara halstedii]